MGKGDVGGGGGVKRGGGGGGGGGGGALKAAVYGICHCFCCCFYFVVVSYPRIKVEFFWLSAAFIRNFASDYRVLSSKYGSSYDVSWSQLGYCGLPKDALRWCALVLQNWLSEGG